MSPLATEALEIPRDDSTAVVKGRLSPRVSMVRKLTDLVVMPLGKLSNNERSFTADLLIKALGNVNENCREEAAIRMSGFAEIPSQLQRQLVLDVFSVAAPVIEYASSIPDAILVEACAISERHRKEIAIRDDVSSQVAETLIEFNEAEITRILLMKQDLVLPDHVIDTLVSRAQNDIEVRPFLIKRLELKLTHGMTMFWWLDTPQRKAILQRFSLDRGVIQETMHPLFVEIFTADEPDMAVKNILKLIDRRHRPRGRNGEMVTMEVVQKTLQVARTAPNDEFSHAVGLLAGITTETATRILNDWSGEAFAVLCKSIGLSRTSFQELFSHEGHIETVGPVYDDAKVEQLVGVFDSIARDYSRTVLRYWDWKEIEPDVQPTSTEQTGGDEAGGYFGAI